MLLISVIWFCINTLFCVLALYPFALLKWIIPNKNFRRWCTRQMARVGEFWIAGNDLNMKATQNIVWDIQGVDGLSAEKSYLVFSNHQSWMDIVILQHVFNRKIPFIRFFLKQELFYVPFLGLAWWALDFPFMKRHSKAYLKKYPHRRGEDLETTRRAVRRFRGTPVSVLNFLEGTRFTPEKHRRQESPYKNLLIPKSGGIGFALNTMGEQFDSLIDVTLHYPEGVVSLGQAFAGRLPKVVVRVNKRPIPANLVNKNYMEDLEFRQNLQAWIKSIWQDKDQLLSHLKSAGR